MEWLIAIIISSIGIGLALSKSTWTVDYAVLVFVLNRGLRRVVDFYFNGAFNPLSPISLTPLIIAGAMAVPWLVGFGQLPRSLRTIFLFLGGAIGYAFFVGFLRVQLASIYALGEVLAPIAMTGYVIICNPDIPVRDRWVRSFAWGAILASGYGWYQYLTIPPWDAFWVVETGLVGYMGIPEPTKMSVFSTMAERGVLAGYLGFSVVPMIVSSKWRTFLSWPAVILVFSTIILTTARAGLIVAVIGGLVFVLVNRGKSKGQIALTALVVAAAAWFGMDHVPGNERLSERLQTLGSIRDDGSYRARIEIMSSGPGAFLANPFGNGLGAAGLGTRVNTGTQQTTTTFGDASYFQILLVYGVIGTTLLLRGLYLAWKRIAISYRVPTLRNDHVLLSRALLIAMIPACWVGDVLTGFSIFWLALGCGLAIPRDAIRKAIALVEGIRLSSDLTKTRMLEKQSIASLE
jgi:hypothetical protein